MKIAIAVDGSCRDADVLSWAAWFARPGDDVHVVHAYQELALGGSAWLPAVRANDRRRHDAWHILTRAQSVLHAALAPHDRQIAIGGSTITGWPHRVLADMSTIVDLLIVGTRPGPGPACSIDAACPVTVVPKAWTAQRAQARSVGVVCGRDLSVRAMDSAAGLAQRLGMTVVVVQVDDTSQGDANALERLDLQIADWEGSDAAPIVTEIRHEEVGDALRSLKHVLALVVVDTDSLSDRAARVAVDELNLPVMLVGTDSSVCVPPRDATVVLASS